MTDTKISVSEGPPEGEPSSSQPGGAIKMQDLGKTPRAEENSPASPEPANPANPVETAGGSSTSKLPALAPNRSPVPLYKGKGRRPETMEAISKEEEDAIGAALDGDIKPITREDGLVCLITLLLTSGARHPYKIDDKYLTKRNVNVPESSEPGKKDPFSISVYTLKELILREWRDEWEPKPSSPSMIRLIHFGKLLDDKLQLREYRFSAEHPNVVHMSVKPQELVDDDEPKGGSKSSRTNQNADRPVCECCVIL